VSSQDVPARDQWRTAQPTSTMAPVTDTMAPGAATTRTAGRVRARKARLVLGRIDPWSVMKLAFLLSIALAVVAVVAVFVLWSVLDAMGVFDSVGSTVESVTRSQDNAQGVDILSYVGLGKVLSITFVLAAVNVVLMTALCTLAAFLYNMAAGLVGGLHVTFTEDV
jgi:hypothetical protein